MRIWDLERAAEKGSKVPPFVVVPGHHGGMVSQICASLICLVGILALPLA